MHETRLKTGELETVWWRKSNFLGLFPQSGEDQWNCEIDNYFSYNSKILPLCPCIWTFFEQVWCKKFWVTLSQECVLAQEIQLSLPDRFSLWEGGVWLLSGWGLVAVRVGSEDETIFNHLQNAKVVVKAFEKNVYVGRQRGGSRLKERIFCRCILRTRHWATGFLLCKQLGLQCSDTANIRTQDHSFGLGFSPSPLPSPSPLLPLSTK